MNGTDALLAAMRMNAEQVVAAREALATAVATRDELWRHAREQGVGVRVICDIYDVTHGRVAQVTGAKQ